MDAPLCFEPECSQLMGEEQSFVSNLSSLSRVEGNCEEGCDALIEAFLNVYFADFVTTFL